MFGNRPLAAVPAMDLNLEHLGNMLDEDIAIKLGFVIRDLQYVRISLSDTNLNKKTRVTGRIRSTVQSISKGRAGISVSLSARVVRDLHSLTGADLIADEQFFKKLAGNFKKEERDRDTSATTGTRVSPAVAVPSDSSKESIPTNIKKKSTPSIVSSSSCESSHRSSESECSQCTIYSSCSSEDEDDPHNHRMRCTPHNEAHIRRVCDRDKMILEWEAHSNIDESSDRSSERNCSECTDCTCSSSDEDDMPESHIHRLRCVPHDEAHVNRVRGRNKMLQEARSLITPEAEEAERTRRKKFQPSPEEMLNQSFPGGARNAHRLSKRWADEEKKKRLEELNSIQATMMKKKKADEK